MGRLRRSAEWRFFGVLRDASPRLTYGFWALIVLRGALPAAFAVVMGVVVGAVQRGDSLAAPLAAIALVFVAMQALGPLHDALGSNLGARATNLLHERLLHACAGPPGLAHLEHPELADELSAAREFDLGLTGPNITVCMPNIAGGLAALCGGLAQALLLFGYRWWAPLLVGGAWASTHWLLKAGAVWHARQSDEVIEQQRRAGYAYNLSVQSPGSKEVRLFGLADWVVGGFASIRRALLDQSWEARRLGWRKTELAMALVVGANGLFFWALARSATGGDVGVGSLVVFAQAAIGASTLAFGEFDWWFRTAAQPVPLLLDLAERMRPAGALPAGSTDAAAMPAHEIRFDGVRFAYPTTARVEIVEPSRMVHITPGPNGDHRPL